MLPLEFVATPAASPRCMSGGSLMKFGTESKLSSGADVDCAKADGLNSTKSPASNRFITTSLEWRVPAVLWLDAGTPPPMAAVYKRAPLQHNRLLARGRTGCLTGP